MYTFPTKDGKYGQTMKQMSQNKAEENFPFEDATALQLYPPFDQRILLKLVQYTWI